MKTGLANRFLPSMGIQVGLVRENQDPERMHRVLVEFPADSVDGPVKSHWCRIISPMAGADRGLVMIPDIGTEVVVGFATRSLNPYILGAVYNGKEDKPEPYKNDDEENNVRIMWSRNDHMIRFDDTSGAEKVGLGAQAKSRLDPTSGVIYHELNSAEKVINEYCDGDTLYRAGATFSVKCKSASIEADNSVSISSGANMEVKAGSSVDVSSGGLVTLNGVPKVFVNTGSSASPSSSMPVLVAKHPPKN